MTSAWLAVGGRDDGADIRRGTGVHRAGRHRRALGRVATTPPSTAQLPALPARTRGIVATFSVVASVQIVAAKSGWAAEFEAIAAHLRTVLAATAVRIDHVGSTSVEGLAAKDVIDIQVTVAGESALQIACELLLRARYVVDTDGCDHIVPGEPDDPDLWRKGFASERPGERRSNIHLRIDGRPNQVYALLFRDYLREHPTTAEAYAQFKARAAVLLP